MNSETKVKQRPILFSTPMVQAILEGRKTVTRRAVKAHLDDRGLRFTRRWEDWHGSEVKCPYGPVGDILWVRESFSKTPDFGYVYKASQTPVGEETRQDYLKAGNKWAKWKPSIHMPYDACRLFLQITDIKVERLQDISEEDAKKEGVIENRDGSWHDYLEPVRLYQDDAKASFISLWESINGPGSWERNEWVWVVSFKRIEKPAQ